MSDTAWKAYERRVAALLGGKRIPVTGEREGADVESVLALGQCKKRKRMPEYLFSWLDGIRRRAKDKGKLGIVVMQRPGRLDLESVVIMRFDDFLDITTRDRCV